MTSNLGTSLPFYSRGSPVPISPFRGFRLREKYLIAFGAILLICIVYSGFVFLPDASKPSHKLNPTAVRNIREQVQEVFKDPQQLVIPPPIDADVQRRHGLEGEDPHMANDQFLLKQKIDMAQIPAPDPIKAEQHYQKDIIGEKARSDDDPVANDRREKIKQMMITAWDGYAKYAWGENELKPSSKVGHSASIFGQSALGATIIDALDTLYIMGLLDRFNNGKKFVEMSFDFKNLRGDVSVFETNIRFVGGLLACYALTKDPLFKNKAVEIADVLLPAFNTPSGIPFGLINAKTGSGKNWGWASGGSSILSEFGTLHLEFDYLSVITGNPVYLQKVNRIREVLESVEKPDGFYLNYINPRTGKWGARHVSLGALGDSFYEYLLKSWVATNKRDVQAKTMYDQTMNSIVKQLLQKSQHGLYYFAEMRGSRLDHKMDHLACFSGGMMALHSVHEPDQNVSSYYLNLAKEIGHTCHESYIRTETGIGPESFRFTNEFEAKTINDRDKYYILRPEVIETWFYLWRITKDPKYREWAWDAAMAIETYCKAGDIGYAGIRNVYTKNVQQDDVQQSFFLAETLKYLYLIFSNDDVMPLDKWVFNTEAHALPVRIKDQDHAPPS